MDDTGETFKTEFFVAPQQTLLEGFMDMAWDYALGVAHKAGVIPIGPIHIETEIVPAGTSLVDVDASLQEGQPLAIQSLAAALGMRTREELVRVKATMMVGSRLG